MFCFVYFLLNKSMFHYFLTCLFFFLIACIIGPQTERTENLLTISGSALGMVSGTQGVLQKYLLND